MSRTTADAVANFFLRFVCDHGDVLTNLKLQKLLYYAQGWYLGLYGEPLFREKLQAWIHGPVQPRVWRRFKEYGPHAIQEDPSDVDLPQDVKRHLTEVFDAYGSFSAWELQRMTHSEPPWQKARGDLPMDAQSTATISNIDMKVYFKELACSSDGQD